MINLLDESECSKYGIAYPKLDLPDYILEFAGVQQDKAIFEEPKVLETNRYKVGKLGFCRLFNKKKVYQANAGRVILTKVNKSGGGGLSDAKPAGWEHNFIVSKRPPRNDYFYHRTHILGNQLIKNKASYVRGEYILGTRILNAAPTGESMKTYEDKVREWFEEKKVEKVFYKVTPIFRDKERVPRGVRMSAIGFGNGKESSRFDVFIFNIYPEYSINYSTGVVSLKRRLGFGVSSHYCSSYRVNYLMTSIPKKRRLGFSTTNRKNTYENRR